MYSQDIRMEFNIKMYHANNEKWKIQLMEANQLPNQEKSESYQKRKIASAW